MPANPPTARERAEALLRKYHAREGSDASLINGIESALTAAEQRGEERMQKRCADVALALQLENAHLVRRCHMAGEILTAIRALAPGEHG